MAQLTIALDTNDTIKFVDEVAGGGDCGCFCPECRSPLVAKKGLINEWHFAHEAGQERPECLVGALNLFSRLLLEHLQLAGEGIPVQGLIGVTLRAMKLSGLGAPGGLAQLSDDRQVPVFAHVQEPRRCPNDNDGADHLIYTSPTPTSAVLKDRQAANSFIARYARLLWRGDQPQAMPTAPRMRRQVPSLAPNKFNLQSGAGTPVMVYPLKDGTDWIMYKNCEGSFVMRQWPEPGQGWENRFPAGVGIAHPEAGAYEVKDFLSASASLRPVVRKSGLQCHSLDLVQRLLDQAS